MSCRRIAVPLLPTLLLALAPAASSPRQNPFAARPGPEHALLKRLAGEWTTTFAMTMPGAPPMESRGKEVNELLGDLWLVSRYDDPGMMGGAFAGAQLFGYDPDEECYVAAWADSQSPNLSVQKGSYDEASRTLTLTGTSKDPMTGGDSTVRTVMTLVDDDHRTQRMFVPGPGGREAELFTIEYERAK
jgi:hypothetical protein